MSDDKKVAISGAPTYSVRALTQPYITDSASGSDDWGPRPSASTNESQLVYKVDWEIPNDVTDSDYSRRWEYLIVLWYVTITVNNVGSKKETEYTVCLSQNANGTINKYHTYLMGYSPKSDYIVITLANYWPNVCPRDKNPINKNWDSYITIKSIRCRVFAINSKDWDFWHCKFKNRPAKYKNDVAYLETFKYTTTAISYGAALLPSVDALSIDLETMELSTTIYKAGLTSRNPATRTRWMVSRQDNFDKTYSKDTVIVIPGSTVKEHTFSGDQASSTFDAHFANGLRVGEWARIKYTALSLGPGGSETLSKGKVSKSHIFAWPATGSIVSAEPSSVATSTSGSGGSSATVPGTGRIYFKIKTNTSTYRPVDTVTLQRLANTTANTAAKAHLQDGWEDIMSDDGGATGLVDQDIVGATPAPGNYTWYRLKTQHDNFILYSSAYYARFLYRSKPTASDDSVTILDVFPSWDAKHLLVYLVWMPDDSTGNEISWTTDNRVWYSTGSADNWQGQWNEAAATITKLRTKYGASKVPNGCKLMSFYISSVTAGEKYYVRARRYLTDADGNTTYSKWNYFRNADNSLMAVCCTAKPTGVKLTAPSYLIKGNAMPVTWTANVDSPIKYWQIVGVKSKTVNGVKTDTETVLATGTTNVTYTTLDAATLSKFIGKDTVIYLGCRIHTGGTISNLAKTTVKIVNNPTLTVTFNTSTKDGVRYLRAQPLQVKVKSNDSSATIITKVIAKGVTTEFPDGPYTQENGEVIWSGSGKCPVTDEWTTITLPNTVKFIDGAQYTIETVAVNKTTGLSSPVRSFDITANWSRKIKAPGTNITITSTTKKPSNNRIFAQINLVAQTGWIESDRFDIYRVTPDGVSLYAKGCQAGYSYVDWWAPYCDTGYLSTQGTGLKDASKATAKLVYRVVARSTNGDMQWRDIPYNIKIPYVRIDWRKPGVSYGQQDDTFITFPYNLVINDTYSKDFEKRKHLDGRIQGYWNEGIERTRTITTDVIRLKNADQIAKIREMARHVGPMFVRTPDGCAFEANVTVNGMDNTYNKPLMSVSLNIEEIDLTRDFGHPTRWAQS